MVPFSKHDLQNITEVMDSDGSGLISKGEFCHSILSIAEGVRPMSIMEIYYTLSLTKSKMDKFDSDLQGLKTLVSQSRKEMESLSSNENLIRVQQDLSGYI